jgi:hypothetical protein
VKFGWTVLVHSIIQMKILVKLLTNNSYLCDSFSSAKNTIRTEGQQTVVQRVTS